MSDLVEGEGAARWAAPAAIGARDATLDDLPALAALEIAAHHDPWTAAQLEAELHTPHAHVWCLPGEVGDEAAMRAQLIFWLIADEAHILNVATHPAWKRRGLASALLKALLARAALLGVTQALLEVRRSNAAAIGLYARHGFEIVGARRGYYAGVGGAPDEDALLMTREILCANP